MSDRPAAGTTAGSLLRAARERQGMHIGALAASIKVTARKLEALEQDRLDELPDATFTRALAQSVCRTLKIESAPVLALLPPSSAQALGPRARGLNAPFQGRPGRADPALSLTAIRPLVWAASALIIGAAVVYFWPAGVAVSSLIDGFGPAAALGPGASDAPSFRTATGGSAPTGVPAAAASLPAGPADPASFAAKDPAVGVAAASNPPAVGTVFPGPPSAFSGGGAASVPISLLQVRSSEPSWVQVRDAGDQLLLSRTVQPGESVHLEGALPLRLTIGNAVATQLAFRGQAVDLASRSKDNIARFELR